nr:hypothetical protein [Actinophytocola xanthii]
MHCGKPPAEGDHGRCARLRAAVDPPRYCPECARRMVVQVTPTGWSARCSRHGERSSRAEAFPRASAPEGSSFNAVSPTD